MTQTDATHEESDELEFNSLVISTIAKDNGFTHIRMKLPAKELVAKVCIKVDTGAQRNTIPLRMYRRMYLENLDADGYPKAGSLIHRDIVLSVYNKSTITHYRVLKTECCHGNQPWITEELYKVDTDSPAILSYKTSLKMKLITVNFSVTESTSRQDEATQPAVTSIKGLKHNWELRGRISYCPQT